MERSIKQSEKLFCLAINPQKGGIFLNASSTLAMTISGMVFIELMSKGLITLENGMVRVVSDLEQDDEIYSFFMRKIKARRKSRKLRNWISYFNLNGRKIQKHFIRSLVWKNVLRTEERHILFVPYEKVFIQDHFLVESIRNEVEETFWGRSDGSDEALILATMVEKTNLLSSIFSERAKRKAARQFVKSLPGTPVSRAVQDAIQMMNAMVFSAAT